ncbi:hypothetical protein, partial [Xenorhabdus beddingii]|uniref:hypothetical protein n=1 Tax=Xenorhabdus beddingii TaxID=40578 RepID=UPI001ABFB316
IKISPIVNHCSNDIDQHITERQQPDIFIAKNIGLGRTVELAKNALPKAGGVIGGGLIVESDFWVKSIGSPAWAG